MSSLIENLRTDREKSMARLEELLPTDADGKMAKSEDAPEWTDETQAEYDKIILQVQKIDSQLKAHRERESLNFEVDAATESEKAAEIMSRTSDKSVDELTSISLQNKRDFQIWATTGKLNDVHVKEMKSSGMARPTMVESPLNTASNERGGYLVPEEYSTVLIESLKSFGGVLENVDVESVADGRKRNYPAINPTSEVGEILETEHESATADDGGNFSRISIEQEMFSSKELRISWEEMDDVGVGLLDHVSRRLATRIARFANDVFTNGNSGTTKIFGIIEGATNGATTGAGDVDTFDYDDIVDLYHSVNSAYRAFNPLFMMSDSAVAALQKIVDGNSRPIWTPGLTESAPDRLLGRPIVVNDDVPDPAASANSILFGAFNFYKVLISRQTELYRLDGDANTRMRRTGFLAYARMGGRMLDNSGGAVKYLTHAAS